VHRFLCDRMLARLGRFLRAAGYDTEIAHAHADDGRLLARAASDGRVLLSCDRAIGDRRAGANVLLLPSNGLDAQARALTRALDIDWELAPFTRCLVDNAPLRDAREDEIARLPPRARALGGPYRACPMCARLYWPGSHVKRMRARLARWQKAREAS
jgi:uncharacterized protein with PIN domain